MLWSMVWLRMRLILLCFCLAAWAVSAQTNFPPIDLSNPTNLAIRVEQIRNACIQGRRHVCGRVLEVVKGGLVIDSGYPTLLQPPLNHSWVTRASAAPVKPAAQVEANMPDCMAIGLVFLTDLPRRPVPHQYDYVALNGYPCGQYEYVPVAGVHKTIRKFAGGLETAVRLNLEMEKKAAAPANTNRPQAYLQMPDRADGVLPALLSQTGAFKDTRHLVPSEGLIPYDLNISFWSDGAQKRRWMSLPDGKIGFATQGEWTFPNGTVFVKNFELPTNDADPSQCRRLETRLLVRSANGSVYGATYKWRPDDSDADLLATNLTEDVIIHTSTGTRTQTWYYPSRDDCRTCHTDRAGLVLGVKTRQFNRDILSKWSDLGLFDHALSDAELASCKYLARADDSSRSLEDRARSYLDVNCGNCHRPGGTVAYFDARFDTPLEKQGLVDGPVLINEGVDHARLISPNDRWRSILYMRANSNEGFKMPPLARQTIDRNGMNLLREWIESLGGPPVLAPPEFSLAAGNYAKPIDVVLSESVTNGEIHYTLDGSVPGTNDPVFKGPIHLANSTTIRAKAYKPGYTRSITSQETFIIGE
jgi:uncharacterized repeat protein (TIGR03806 family)